MLWKRACSAGVMQRFEVGCGAVVGAQVQERLNDGSGNFDADRLLVEMPRELAIPQKKVDAAMKTLTKDKRRTVLVQARAPSPN